MTHVIERASLSFKVVWEYMYMYAYMYILVVSTGEVLCSFESWESSGEGVALQVLPGYCFISSKEKPESSSDCASLAGRKAMGTC